MAELRLEELNINPKTILDIGAHSGEFYGWAKKEWPNSVIWMIEANHLHDRTLYDLTKNVDDGYAIAALGDEEREVTFYTRSDKPDTAGNSYYEESNYWDIQHLVQKNKITLQKLDDMFTDDTTFELIKIDTQGSELDILNGGKILCKKASVIILEVAYMEYNKGAPLKDEVISFMEDFGFEKKMSIGEHYSENKMIQKDLVFLNRNL
jgi:FkbM family methyltransferase